MIDKRKYLHNYIDKNIRENVSNGVCQSNKLNL